MARQLRGDGTSPEETNKVRRLSAEHIAAMQAGRRRGEIQRQINEARRKREFRTWSLQHARTWAEWQTNCGKAKCSCEWCGPFRATTSAIPDMRGVDGEKE